MRTVIRNSTTIRQKKQTKIKGHDSSIDWYTSKISKFVDYYLQPHVKALPYHVQDTTDFINKL